MKLKTKKITSNLLGTISFLLFLIIVVYLTYSSVSDNLSNEIVLTLIAIFSFYTSILSLIIAINSKKESDLLLGHLSSIESNQRKLHETMREQLKAIEKLNKKSKKNK